MYSNYDNNFYDKIVLLPIILIGMDMLILFIAL